MAHYLMAIAKDERIVRHVELMPPDTNSLYKLTQLSESRFSDLLQDGTINPGMKRNEAF